MVKKRIFVGLLSLFGVIALGTVYFVTANADALKQEDSTEAVYEYESDSSQDADVTVEVESYDYNVSDALKQEDSTEAVYEYKAVGMDFYEYDYEDDDTAEIKVEKYEFTD